MQVVPPAYTGLKDGALVEHKRGIRSAFDSPVFDAVHTYS